MDWTTIGASVGSFVLGIGAIWAVVQKVLPKAVKYAMIAKDAIEMVNDTLDALKDGKLEASEIAEIKKHADALMADLKK